MRAFASVQNRTDVRRLHRYAGLVILLVLVALCVVAAGIATALRRSVTGSQPDLGWVSERWLSEYRADASRPQR